jgi:hypothetical protein
VTPGSAKAAKSGAKTSIVGRSRAYQPPRGGAASAHAFCWGDAPASDHAFCWGDTLASDHAFCSPALDAAPPPALVLPPVVAT